MCSTLQVDTLKATTANCYHRTVKNHLMSVYNTAFKAAITKEKSEKLSIKSENIIPNAAC